VVGAVDCRLACESRRERHSSRLRHPTRFLLPTITINRQKPSTLQSIVTNTTLQGTIIYNTFCVISISCTVATNSQ
jgi:hypothetical protein